MKKLNDEEVNRFPVYIYFI